MFLVERRNLDNYHFSDGCWIVITVFHSTRKSRLKNKPHFHRQHTEYKALILTFKALNDLKSEYFNNHLRILRYI